MKRDLSRLAGKSYDLLVIGGGISGVCIAWDATLRGLGVALVDKGDFGAATSANSLKTVHGGLRYLQDANLSLMRTMIRERKAFLRIAPHLVHPLPVLMPTYRKLMRSKPLMSVALKLNDMVGLDRNWDMDQQKNLPNSRVISRDECLRLLPGVEGTGITGGALWYDAQMYNSERLLLSFVLSATQAGAEVANYVEVIGFLKEGNRITGVKARDVLINEEFDIQAKIVVNATGAWTDSVLELLDAPQPTRRFCLSTAINLVTRQILPDYATGISSTYWAKDRSGVLTERSHLLFFVPWRHYTLVGTIHAPYGGHPDEVWLTQEAVQAFIEEINRAYPAAELRLADVYWVHKGYLPAIAGNRIMSDVKLVRHGLIYDEQKERGIAGLITAVGVKYTTARHLAQKVVDLVFQKVGHEPPPCQTHVTPLYDGQIKQFNDFLTQARDKRPEELEPGTVQHLVYNYGSAYRQLITYLDEDPCWGQPVTDSTFVTRAEVLHGVREEMAQKLTDVVLRRTELGSAGKPDDASLQTCARIMAAELGWDRNKVEKEIREVCATYEITA